MKLPPQIQIFIQTNRRLLIIVSVLFLLLIAGLVFRLLTPSLSPSAKPPTYAPVTPKVGLASPQTVNLNRLKSVTLPATAPSYHLSLSDLKNHLQIANNLGLSGPAKVIQNFQIYSNNNFSLTVDPTNHQLFYVYTNAQLLNAKGAYATSGELFNKTVTTLKNINVYDQSLSFQLLSSEYRKIDDAYLLPVTASESSVIQLTLTPQINNQPIYLQQPMVTATYNRQNVLLKLDIFSPFNNVTAGETTNLLTIDQVHRLQPAAFFPLYVTPGSQEEAWTGPAGLSAITPQELSLGYFLDTTNNLLQPIFTFKGSAAVNQPYLYATLAFPTNPAP
jgi:hypothetical protein